LKKLPVRKKSLLRFFFCRGALAWLAFEKAPGKEKMPLQRFSSNQLPGALAPGLLNALEGIFDVRFFRSLAAYCLAIH
jgi:hypothetical protein